MDGLITLAVIVGIVILLATFVNAHNDTLQKQKLKERAERASKTELTKFAYLFLRVTSHFPSSYGPFLDLIDLIVDDDDDFPNKHHYQ